MRRAEKMPTPTCARNDVNLHELLTVCHTADGYGTASQTVKIADIPTHRISDMPTPCHTLRRTVDFFTVSPSSTSAAVCFASTTSVTKRHR